MDEIIIKLKYLDFPFILKDMNLFYESLNSPTQIRYNTMEWLFSLMEKENIDVLISNEKEKYSQEEKIILLFQLFNLDETKDNILGYSTEINNNKTFLNLLNFVIKYINIKQNKNIFNQEIESSIKFVDIINKNKIELFKKNIRLFIYLKQNEKDKINKDNFYSEEDRVNIKKINESINNCKLLIEKVERKLEKLKNFKINDNNEQQNIYDKLELKKTLMIFEKSLDEFLIDFNNNYEKELKYIHPDNISHLDEKNTELLNEYKKIENIASLLEEIFALHNKIIT